MMQAIYKMLLSSLLILMNYCNLPAFTKLFAQTNSNDGSTAKTGYLYEYDFGGCGSEWLSVMVMVSNF
jgi:hypothetical protein